MQPSESSAAQGHWFDFTLPWERPSWGHPLRMVRWRRQQERIRDLEWRLLFGGGVGEDSYRYLPWENRYSGAA